MNLMIQCVLPKSPGRWSTRPSSSQLSLALADLSRPLWGSHLLQPHLPKIEGYQAKIVLEFYWTETGPWDAELVSFPDTLAGHPQRSLTQKTCFTSATQRERNSSNIFLSKLINLNSSFRQTPSDSNNLPQPTPRQITFFPQLLLLRPQRCLQRRLQALQASSQGSAPLLLALREDDERRVQVDWCFVSQVCLRSVLILATGLRSLKCSHFGQVLQGCSATFGLVVGRFVGGA